MALQLVTLTNYTGETREYVKTLIDIMGGKFSPDFSRHNTHVIASVCVSLPDDSLSYK